MPYSAEISRVSPACILFLIDQSHSMTDPWGGTGDSKAVRLATVVNKALSNLVIASAKQEGVRDFFHVGMIGYGDGARSAFSGSLAGESVVPISRIANEPARVEERQQRVDDGAGGLVDQTVKFPVWLDPVATNGTPMCAALELAEQTVRGWVRDRPDGFPPIVINITDGEANDGDPVGPAAAVRSVSGSDGDVLLFNLHLSGQSDTM